LPVLDRAGVPHYHVDMIVGERGARAAQELRVRWLGFPSSSDTWEPRVVLEQDCPEAVRDWDARRPNRA
jgi:hypothetical protein